MRTDTKEAAGVEARVRDTIRKIDVRRLEVLKARRAELDAEIARLETRLAQS